MKTVITGATGFIGTALTARLLAQHHTVTALSRDPARARETLGDAVRCLDWSGDGEWQEAARDADTVFHLAGEPIAGQRWTSAFKTKVLESRVNSTRRIVDAQPTGVLVSASAVGYYGDRHDDIITETDPPGDDFLAEVCVAWEAEAHRATTPSRVVTPRIGIVLGQGGGPLQSLLYPPGSPISPFKIGLGGPLGSGRQWVPWVHRDDLVSMLIWAATEPGVRGVFNAVAPNPVTSAELAHAIGRVYHKPAVLSVPEFALKAVVGDFAYALLYSQRVAPTVAASLGFAYRFPEIDGALQDLLAG